MEEHWCCVHGFDIPTPLKYPPSCAFIFVGKMVKSNYARSKNMVLFSSIISFSIGFFRLVISHHKRRNEWNNSLIYRVKVMS
jgi:hypothetical protein